MAGRDGPALADRPPRIRDRPALTDPLAQVIGLLQPSASFSKLIFAAGAWAVRPFGA